MVSANLCLLNSLWHCIRLNDHQAFAPPRHQRDSKIQNSRSMRRKHGRLVRLRSSTAI